MNVYRYKPNRETLDLILNLAEEFPDLHDLISYPHVGECFLTRLAILYEHAPSFLLGGEVESERLKELVLVLALSYLDRFLRNVPDVNLQPNPDPRRVVMSTFWHRDVWDPVEHLIQAAKEGIEGVEIALDFHPFNPTKLLPCEIPPNKRHQLRYISKELNVRLSYHSPIVGPYSSPDPSGRQLFYDPAENVELMKEVIELARETGAEAVVIHLVDPESLERIIEIINSASGSDVVVALENYYQTGFRQDSEAFISVLEKLKGMLDPEVLNRNFGVTFDPGHYNVEGEDPIISASRVGRWCRDNGIRIVKFHATVNYGPLHCFPPNYSSDVHDRVSSKGINNPLIIKLLRSMGHTFSVTAEQIAPLDEEDKSAIDEAQRAKIDLSYEAIVRKGKEVLTAIPPDRLITTEFAREEAYQFIAGLEGIEGLREYMIYRQVQQVANMTSETAKTATTLFMNLSEREQKLLLNSLDNLLLSSIGPAYGEIGPEDVEEICERLSGAILEALNRQMLAELFSEVRTLKAGDVICHEGDVGDEMFYIKNGFVGIYLDEISVARLGPGEVLGEMSIFYNLPRTATIKAQSDLELGVINREKVLSILREKGDQAKALLYRLYMILPRRVREMNLLYTERFGYVGLEIGQRLIDQMIALEGFPLMVRLDRMNSEELKDLFEDGRFYPEGVVIIKKGSDGSGIYFIDRGSVRVVDFQEDKPVLLALLNEGEIFGEMSVIDRSKTSATVISEGAFIRFLPRRRFNEILSSDPGLSYRLISTLCSILMDRLYRLDRLFKLTKTFVSNVA
ncbi:TPA: cyclic nucleotide-binding domain-containing protein [Candidatus Poribacteria bacterium]|nr:cyclic nucleotide-binding domain-containing protein [Candidatus Poribacteria bacterium]HEX29185.1 cyclic nucleotide-binding domain-containing protein [Candidatus Poribacteria bacterium]